MLNIIFYFILFSFIDWALYRQYPYLNGIYYINHTFHNSIVMASVLYSSYDIIMPVNLINLVTGFHVYHLVLYTKKCRSTEWTHHLLLCGMLLLARNQLYGGHLVNYALFATTGFPSIADYAMLALERNDCITTRCYRLASKHFSIWIRSPACIIIAYETARYAYELGDVITNREQIVGYIYAALLYFNGIFLAMRGVEASYKAFLPQSMNY
jgi:hypothetical protein